MLHEEVQQACLRKGFREVFKDLLSHQVTASAFCCKMECDLLNHISMDEMAFVCKFKIIILILMHLVMYIQQMSGSPQKGISKIILPISGK